MIRPAPTLQATLAASPFLAFLIVAAFGLTTSASASEVVIAHDGNSSPNTEGWQVIGTATGNVTFGPLVDSGSPSWFVRDFDSSGGSNYRYQHTFPADELCGLQMGWTLRAELRLPSAQTTGAILLEVNDGERRFVTLFNRTGATTEASMGGVVAAAPLTDYNTYEMVFDPILESVSLFVNGALAIDGYAGLPAGSIEPRVNWGSGSSAGQGEANFRLVEFEMTPDPNTTFLTGPADSGYISNGITLVPETVSTTNINGFAVEHGFLEFPISANLNRIIFQADFQNTTSLSVTTVPRSYELKTYAGNGSITLSDFQAGGPTVSGREANVPGFGSPSTFPYSIDLTDEVDSLLSSNASHLGVELSPVTGQVLTSMAQLVACPEPTLTTGLGLGVLILTSAGRRRFQ
ncbi:MAG: hypothetical protein AB8G23_24970 [Myxococcota bacterium]